jgi:cation transport regulator
VGRKEQVKAYNRQTPRAKQQTRTSKQIDSLPVHARHIFKNAHKNALKQYQSPSKRRGGKRQSRGQVAHKVAWSAVKRKYQKEGNRWVPND